jgi:predicted GNAT family acetyltransferase
LPAREASVEFEIRHDEKGARFVAEVDEEEAVLEYERLGEATLDYRHTFVPRRLRDEGIGSDLVRFALDWAAENDHRIVPTCPFVRSYLEDHPEISGVIAQR